MRTTQRGTSLTRLIGTACLLIGAALALLTPATVLAATRQVATGGTNSGNCIASPCLTITYAIGQALPGDTISVAAGFYTDHVLVDRSLTIAGAGAATTTVDGGLSGRVFTVPVGVTATISGMTIQHGQPAAGQDGGGIYNGGTLTVDHAIVTTNSIKPIENPNPPYTTTNAHGGGIANVSTTTSNATLTLTATTVTNNIAHPADFPPPYLGRDGMGAGIYNEGGLIVQGGSVISNNTIERGSSVWGGGGIFEGPNGTLTVSYSTITGNTAADGGGGAIGDQNGLGSGVITIDHSTVSNNTSSDYAINVAAQLTITNSLITGNGTYAPYGYGGGAIRVLPYGFLTIRDSTISDNYSSRGGTGTAGIDTSSSGVVFELTRSTVSGNDATRNPITNAPGGHVGGIWAGDTSTITDSIISGNTGVSVGGMYLATSGSGPSLLTNSMISGNTATKPEPDISSGGGVGAGGLSINTVNGSGFAITNTTISGNNNNDANGAGGLNLSGITAGATATITGSTISGNTGGSGGVFVHTGVTAYGTPAHLTVTNSTISGNTGSAFYVSAGSPYPSNPTVALTNDTIASNDKGVTNVSDGTVTFTNTILANTLANCSGTGGIASAGYNIEFGTSCNFSGSDLTNTDPKIAALALNAPGATKTHALLPGSPALNRIPNTNGCNNASLTTDQRGVARPQPAGGLCDVGAYEAAPTAPPTPTNLHVTAATYNSVSYAWTNPDPTANILVSDGTTLSHPDATTTPRLPVGTTTFTTYGIAYGSYGCLSIAAWNGVGASAWSTWVCGSVMPITPYNPHKTSATTTGVTFGWSTYDSLSSIAAYDGTTNHALGVNATSYTAPTAAGYFACVTVAAYNATNTSPYSAWACGLALPALPTAVHTTGHTTSSVTFAWTNHDPYSGIALTNDGVHLLNEGINATSYTQTGLASGQYACIEIAAYNSSGASAYTTWVCGQAGP